MLEFEEKFFLEETRDGFYIEPMMKCAWAAQLEVLDSIAKVCSKYNIRWFADYGTLLGAVRHQGFVPWDDDLDICMLRKDYERFLQLPLEEFPVGFHISSPCTSEVWELSFARVINAQSISYDPERLRQYHGCPYIVGIDIFPLDGITDSKSDEDAQRTLVKTLLTTANVCKENMDEILPLIPDLEDLCGVQIDTTKFLPNQLMRALDHVSRRYTKKKMDYIGRIASNRPFHLKYEWYRTTEYLNFENVMLPCPGNYEAVLTAIYGNWQTPVRGRATHDYPFYNKQNDAIIEQMVTRIMRGDLL